MAEYVSIAKAKKLGGLRLILSTGIPGPAWTEAAKAVFHVKKVPFVKVAQHPMGDNEELREWVGRTNAPIAVYDSEPPRLDWDEFLLLAERLAPEPKLIPVCADDRIRFFGLAFEICGEDGFGWHRRILMMKQGFDDNDPRGWPRNVAEYMANRYGYSEKAAARAPARIREILASLSRQLSPEKSKSRKFFIGDTLSALDLYWACFAAFVEPLPNQLCPMPNWVRESYTLDQDLAAEVNPALMAHRDWIYHTYLELPVDT